MECAAVVLSANGGACRSWAAWRRFQGYGASFAGASCQVAVELVRRKVGKVRGHRDAQFSAGLRGGRRAVPGPAWEAVPGSVCGTRGTVRGREGSAGREGLRRGIQMEPYYLKEQEGAGSGVAGSEHQSSRGLAPSLPGLGEMAEPLAGPAIAQAPVILGALTLTCFTPRKRQTGTGQGPCGQLVLCGAPSAPWASHLNKKFIFVQPTNM